jgi:SPP1 family predicted phage head-tail adaptor
MIKALAPRLRHRVDIEDFTSVQNSVTGVLTQEWIEVLDNVPAEIISLSGREFIAANSINSLITTRITIRYIDGIKPRMRIKHGNDIYNIKAVLPDPKIANYLSIMCEGGVNAG